MNLKDKAEELGIPVRTLQDQCVRGKTDATKVGSTWVFPDKQQKKKKRDDPEANLDVIPKPSDFENLKEYFSVLSTREDWLKKKQQRAVAEGTLVVREDLESDYRRVFKLLSKKVMDLPNLLKNRLGDDLSERGELLLERLCKDLLESVADA